MKPRQVLFPVVSVLCGMLLALLLLEGVFRWLPVRDSLMTLPVNAGNPVLRFKENRDVTWSQGPSLSNVTEKHVNNYGFLNDLDYSREDVAPLVAIIGDSFVEASQVANKDALYGILSRDAVGAGRVYSFGASGSPLSTYLAYAEYAVRTFHADALVFVVVGNDFDESLTKYNDTPGYHYFSGVSADASLVRKDFQPGALKRIARESALVRYLALNLQLNRKSAIRLSGRDTGREREEFVGNTRADFNEERVSDSKCAVDRFFQELPVKTGLGRDKILFVLDGMRPQLYDPATLEKASGSYFDLMRRYFSAAASARGYEVIDLQPLFIQKHQSEGTRFEFARDAHWNEAGHALVAESIRASAVYQKVFGRQPLP